MSHPPTNGPPMNLVSAADRSRKVWMQHIAASGPPGEDWCEVYGRHDEVERISTEALVLLRQHRLEEGRARLTDASKERQQLPPGLQGSIVAVLDRWYFGTEGYALFLEGELDRAAEAMEKARQAVIAALSEAPFLMPLANHCQEFTMHRARIERNRRRWAEMWTHIDEARNMLIERQPLCRLQDGSTIDLQTLQHFYEALDLAKEERSAVGVLDSLEQRDRLFGAFLRRLLTPPDFTIVGP